MGDSSVQPTTAGVMGALVWQDLEKGVEVSPAEKERGDECWRMWMTYS